MIAKEPPAPPRPFAVDRRTLMRAGLFGLAAVPAPLLAASFGTSRGFTHTVASGEPGVDKVLLWTRYVGAQDLALEFQVAETMDFADPVAEGSALAKAEHDWCAKSWADGLLPGRWYYYRFIAPDGSISPVGRTRTLPDGPVANWRMAVFSCSNLGFGWFNAYAHAADSGEFDLALHLGDYFYEYQLGTYPSLEQLVSGRDLEPRNEIVALADYRLRYAAYRADPDLQRVHQLYPFITVPDDHETANDSWKGGAENHQPDAEGAWDARKAAAMRANREWLPVSDAMWARYDIGDLATIFRLETRLTARDKQFSLGTIVKGIEPGPQWDAAITKFRDETWRDPARTLMGSEQEGWLANGMKQSVGAKRRWQVLAQQIVMAQLLAPPSLSDELPADAQDWIRTRLNNRAQASRLGVPFNMDAWDGYPAARDRLLDSARQADANLVVLSGDSHNSWASNLWGAGVEFAGHSVTSPGAEDWLRWMAHEDIARRMVEGNSELKWANTGQRGYMAVELTPERATCEYRYLDTVRQKSTRLASTHSVSTQFGARSLTS